MKTSKVFKAAKKGLWNGKSDWFATGKNRFICGSIWQAPNICAEDKRKAINIVAHLLGKFETLEGWLLSNHQISAYQDQPKAQETRRAWLDHLINHYESIGD